MKPKTQAAVYLAKAQFNQGLTINTLARSVQLSRSRLCCLFKSDLGVSPLQYIKMLRMEKAKELLVTSLMSIKEIAAIIGYNDANHFMREFKRNYGKTPSQYRAQKFAAYDDWETPKRQKK